MLPIRSGALARDTVVGSAVTVLVTGFSLRLRLHVFARPRAPAILAETYLASPTIDIPRALSGPAASAERVRSFQP
eukprot:3940388-Rhodomonas_salina.4